MASCKDCVHADMCKYKDLPAPLSDSYIRESECIEKRCGDFKDRSRFVKLPCNLGDLVYFIKARRVMADIVSKFTIDRCGVMLQRVNGYNLGYTDQLGKKIFLTREEAEQALKEREKR